eukprot:153212_1
MAMKGIHCSSGDVTGIPPPLNIMDGIACILFVAYLLVEAKADNQQYNFQMRKREWKSSMGANGKFANALKSIISHSSFQEYSDGFCHSGLFAIVRKPMYAAEQA